MERLSSELAVANGELRRQYLEKEALSQRLSMLLAALPAGVVVVDAAGLVSETNAAAQRLLGDDLWVRTGYGACLQPAADNHSTRMGDDISGRLVVPAQSFD